MTTTKRNLLKMLLCTTLAVNSYAQTAPMTEINQRVQAVLNSNPLKIDSALREEALAAVPDFVQLQNLCQTHWSSIIDNFNTLEGGNDGKRLILNACQSLDASDYIGALEKVVARFKAGQLERSIIETALAPTGRMRAFLADNHQHPRVQALLNDLKSRFGDKPDVVAEIDNILNGTTKAEIGKEGVTSLHSTFESRPVVDFYSAVTARPQHCPP